MFVLLKNKLIALSTLVFPTLFWPQIVVIL
jgi:hypothetical protein